MYRNHAGHSDHQGSRGPNSAANRATDPALDVKRFNPKTAAAKDYVRNLIARGAVPVHVSQDSIRLRRQSSIAIVDAWGRVEWI